MQSLMSSLNARNCNIMASRQQTSRFKVRDKMYISPNKDEVKVVEDRKSSVEGLLLYQYQQRVAMRHMEYSPIDEHVLAVVCKYLTDPSSKSSLLMMGPTGTGKTTLMTAIFDIVCVMHKEEIMYKEVRFSYVKASELGETLKYTPDEFKRIKGATVLFVDDLAFSGESELVSEWGTKRRPIDDIIEYRYDRQLATICTTNLTEELLKKNYGERIWSRMREEFIFLPVVGKDFRIK